MRILYINSLYPPNIGGGAEITLTNLVNALSKRGHETAVLTTRYGKGLQIDLDDNVKIYRVGIRNVYWHFTSRSIPTWLRLLWHGIDSYNPFAARDVRRVIRDFKPDIVSCHNLPGFSASAWSAIAKLNIPVVQVLHDYYSICPKNTMFNHGHECETQCKSCKAFRIPHNHLSNKISAVVGVSNAVLTKHLNSGLFENVAIKKVINNAREINTNRATVERDESVFTFGYIGALTEVKGVVPLIESINRIIHKTDKSIRLLIGGTGKDEYVADLKDRFSNESVIFLGKVDPNIFFKQIDVTVVPSIWCDPFPGVVFESIGLGTPVIGTSLGGVPEMVTHEVNGLIYDPKIRGSLDQALLRVINEPDLLTKMRGNSVLSVGRLLDFNRMINEHESLYKAVIKSVSI